MSLCLRCRDISLRCLTAPLPAEARERAAGKNGMIHYQNGGDLVDSALKCPLCELMLAAMGQKRQISWTSTANQQPSLILSSPAIILEPKADLPGSEFPDQATGGAYLNSFIVTATTKGRLIRGKVRLYIDAPTNSPNGRCDVIGRPRLSQPYDEDSFSLLRRWLTTCRDAHIACRETLSGLTVDESTASELPSRVLYVGSGRVHVLVPKGQKGRYAALSHCWGSPSRRPLRTTQESLPDHLEGIPWASLPNTFQDAIAVTRQLGLQYLWIDSLCIVQDDKDDWLRESQKMGSVYERAEITIAASHATGSWEGFMLPRQPAPRSVELPDFITKTEETPDPPRVFASIRNEEIPDIFPEYGTLNRRAWATQEWLLSRRMVFYTNGAVVWSCNVITQRETGNRCFNISRNRRWKSVVENYSERQLSFASDKLIALEGLRTQMGIKSGFTYSFGIWKESLPEQLLWQVAQNLERLNDVLELPTWTWARVPCGVRFLSTKFAHNLCESIASSDDVREWKIRSWMKRLHHVRQELHGEATDKVIMAIRAHLSAAHDKFTTSLAHYGFSGDGIALGWVVYDQWDLVTDAEQEQIFCLALTGRMSRKEEIVERRTTRATGDQLCDYSVLVIRRRVDGRYSRVGIGKFYRKSWWQDADVEAVTLV